MECTQTETFTSGFAVYTDNLLKILGLEWAPDVIVGIQWEMKEKGKIVDMLAQSMIWFVEAKVDIMLDIQFGLMVFKYTLHNSFWCFKPKAINVIGNGCCFISWKYY